MTNVFIFLLIVAVVVLMLQLRGLAEQAAELRRRLEIIEDQRAWERRAAQPPAPAAPVTPPPLPITPPAPMPPWGSSPRPVDLPPVVLPRQPEPPRTEPALAASTFAAETPPVLPQAKPANAPPPSLPAEFPKVNWEGFLGVKLFAWVGGLALFLGVAFFVKYAFERNLISPQLRVAFGYVMGGGLIAGGLWMPRARHLVTVQTLCATGILVLYATTFSAHAYYHFFGTGPALTFGLMSLITAGAFVLAVRLDGQVVAVLGVLGGFLTPPLLSTGVDRALALFGYLALLDAGLVAIAVRKRWTYLLTLGAVATVLTQWGWVFKFFVPEKLATGMTIFLGFGALFAAALAAAQRRQCADGWVSAAAIVPATMALGFGLFVAALAGPPWLAWQLFGYVALADALLLGLALWRRWNALALVAAAGTALAQWCWVTRFMNTELVLSGMAVFLGFAGLFAGALVLGQCTGRADGRLSSAAAMMPSMAFGFALYLMLKPVPGAGEQVWLLFGFVLLADGVLLGLTSLREELRATHLLAGGAVFGLLGYWTMAFLTPTLLTPALVLFLVFAVLHAACPLALQRLKPSRVPVGWAHLFPATALVLILIPLSRFAESSFVVWPAVMIIDLLAIVLAVMTASLLAILAVFVLTVMATALWIFQLSPSVTEAPGMLIVIGGFAVFFMAAAVLAARRVFTKAGQANGASGTAPTLSQEMFTQIASLAALLPFLLLTMVIVRLPLAGPAAVFWVAAGLVFLLLGLSRWLANAWLPVVALGAVLLVEYAWHFARLGPASALESVCWYLGFSAVFLVFPFLFQKRFANITLPWAVAALAFPLHFPVIYRGLKTAWPEMAYPGLIPAALIVPSLVALLRVARPWPVVERERLAPVALFGGATLFFVTLIFPIQFERQWITVGWALEGAALLALFHRVPHPGLRAVGVALLLTSFVRLAFNPWIITAYGRTGTPLLNWYLYAYGIVAACLIAGGRLLAPPRNKLVGVSAPPLLYALGGILTFMLLNIEIADYFSPPGGRLVFHFSANFYQDMTYSLAWALFAFVLLAIGVKLDNAATRYAGLGLLIGTLLKLFLHDLWRLGGLYRVGSLVGLAVVLLVVSFIYQRFLSSGAVRQRSQADPPGSQDAVKDRAEPTG